MSARRHLSELQQHSKVGLIVPDSTLYRALKHVARAIARKLSATHADAKKTRCPDNDKIDQSDRATD